ncbi:hypothetical protein [Bradyrhizobium sp. ORS 86]|uniref:hypothetical protein n=1 Tax=Bradyrhizobium sp. ORS 86 TaxID=1685970 RepID=UPI00388E8CCE
MQAAKVLWHPIGEMAQAKDPTVFGGNERTFDSVERAVIFVMEQIPLPDRMSAMIQTDQGSIDFGEMETIYASLKSAGGQDGGG